MMVQVLSLILIGLGLLTGCAQYHQPIAGPESDPLTYPPVRGQAGRNLTTLHEIPTGVAGNYQAYPVLEPDEIVRVWVVGQTRSDIVHVHGHWLTINYRPSRFKPDAMVTRNRVPTGRLLDTPKEREDQTESSQAPLRFGRSSPAPQPSTTASGRDETEAVRQAYLQIQKQLQQQPGAAQALQQLQQQPGAAQALQQLQKKLKQPGAAQGLEQQIREMTRQIQQRSRVPSP